jgi:RNase H-fold protein (predicted Holliday junction resolvase)
MALSLAARRRLQQLAGQERRFAKDVNHTISKRIIATAERTKRAMSLEDLKGIPVVLVDPRNTSRR